MGSCEVTPPPESPVRRLYHITSAAFATSNIALQRIKIARWGELNDPFELLPYKTLDRRTQDLQAKFKRQIDRTDGLLCFSRDWTSPLLWSHYGDKHHGIALGFDVDTSALLTTEVEYSEARLSGSKMGLELLHTKAHDWKYEEEVRVHLQLQDEEPESSLFFFRLDESLRLREVILGPQCTQSLAGTRELVAARCPEAVVFQARCAHGHFKVVPNETTVPPWSNGSTNSSSGL